MRPSQCPSAGRWQCRCPGNGSSDGVQHDIQQDVLRFEMPVLPSPHGRRELALRLTSAGDLCDGIAAKRSRPSSDYRYSGSRPFAHSSRVWLRTNSRSRCLLQPRPRERIAEAAAVASRETQPVDHVNVGVAEPGECLSRSVIHLHGLIVVRPPLHAIGSGVPPAGESVADRRNRKPFRQHRQHNAAAPDRAAALITASSATSAQQAHMAGRSRIGERIAPRPAPARRRKTTGAHFATPQRARACLRRHGENQAVPLMSPVSVPSSSTRSAALGVAPLRK